MRRTGFALLSLLVTLTACGSWSRVGSEEVRPAARAMSPTNGSAPAAVMRPMRR